jgi:hypothetical protein
MRCLGWCICFALIFVLDLLPSSYDKALWRLIYLSLKLNSLKHILLLYLHMSLDGFQSLSICINTGALEPFTSPAFGCSSWCLYCNLVLLGCWQCWLCQQLSTLSRHVHVVVDEFIEGGRQMLGTYRNFGKNNNRTTLSDKKSFFPPKVTTYVWWDWYSRFWGCLID